jgi:predicted membrane-bound spermidine synthase
MAYTEFSLKSYPKETSIIPLFYLLPFIILIEGFASIAIEILAIRQLIPVAGSSVIVTSLIIGIFLLSLAFGYEKGGRVTQYLHRTLRRNFLLVAVWVGIGLSYFFINLYFYAVQHYVGAQIIYPLLSYLCLILAPAIYLLGQTLPITMNIVKQDQSAGKIAGNSLGLSTLGSFLGAVLTTVILMHYFGVAVTVFLIYALLALMALLLSQTNTALLNAVTISLFSGFFVYYANIQIEKYSFSLTDNYANYQIYNSQNSKLAKGEKILIINETQSSFIDNNMQGFPYIKAAKKIILDDLNLRNEDILVLGAGGFTLSADVSDNNNYTYVDIDANIKKVIVPNFITTIKGKLVINDARTFLNTTEKKYKIILIDVYSDSKAIPAHLVTREFMQAVKSHLQPEGYALLNIIANPTFKDDYSRRLDNTIRAAFGSCTVAPIEYKNSATNIIYVCSNETSPKDQVVYVDNLNNSTTDSFNW